MDYASTISNEKAARCCLSKAGSLYAINTSLRASSATELLITAFDSIGFVSFLSTLVAGGLAANRFFAAFVLFFHPALWRTDANRAEVLRQKGALEPTLLSLMADDTVGKVLLQNAGMLPLPAQEKKKVEEKIPPPAQKTGESAVADGAKSVVAEDVVEPVHSARWEESEIFRTLPKQEASEGDVAAREQGETDALKAALDGGCAGPDVQDLHDFISTHPSITQKQSEEPHYPLLQNFLSEKYPGDDHLHIAITKALEALFKNTANEFKFYIAFARWIQLKKIFDDCSESKKITGEQLAFAYGIASSCLPYLLGYIARRKIKEMMEMIGDEDRPPQWADISPEIETALVRRPPVFK
jgi:hypothetical protein